MSKKKQLGKLEHTERGFEVIRFDDINGESCSLQQSSLAVYAKPGSSAVWLGMRDKMMHLDVAKVGYLVLLLTRWIETGSFEQQPTADPSGEKE